MGDPASLFSLFRLLLPQMDRHRHAYGIKEKALANLLVKIFALPKDGSDAVRLMAYRFYFLFFMNAFFLFF